MKLYDLYESVPRTLYHGTIKENLDDIFHWGLEPRIGDFTSYAYTEYKNAGIPLQYVTFAADKAGLGKCISAIIGQMRHRFPQWHHLRGEEEITAKDFYDHAAILVLKSGEKKFVHVPIDSEPTDDQPTQAEPGDYYRDINIMPDYVLTDKRLQNFLRRNHIRLDDYGIQDIAMDRAELIRRGLQPKPQKV